MPTAYTYKAGQVTLTAGSTAVVGVGTAWKLAGIPGGIIFAEGLSLPLDTVTDDTHAVASIEWAGSTGTYDYALVLTVYSQENMQNSTILTRLLAELDAGTIWKYDVAGTAADKSIYDTKPQGFSYLVIDGSQPELYVKGSATPGDWEGPFAYGVGPTGPQGPTGPIGPRGFTPRGTYNALTAYVIGDGVLYNGSTFVATANTTGNAPPTLPTTSNAYWQLVAIKGTDGTGTGDVVGPAGATDDTPSFFDGVTGKLLKSKTKAQFKTWLAATALDVSFDNSVANLAGAPSTVQAAINALAAGGGKNDALFALEIADLKGQRLGMVGGIADSFDDETGVATKTNAAYDATNDWYSPSLGPDTYATVNDPTLNVDSTTWASTSIRQAFAAAVLSGSGNRIRVTFTPPSTGNPMRIDNVFIGPRSGTTGSFASAPTRLTFNGNNAIGVNAGAASVFAEGDYTFSSTTDLLISFDINSVASDLRVGNGLGSNYTRYWKTGATGEAGNTSISGYTVDAGLCNCIDKIEVRTAVGTPNNMTLVSATYPASAVPSTGRVALQTVEGTALTPNTDFTMEVSRDGGTTWTAATLTLSMSFGGVKMYEGNVSLAGQPSGSSMKWRAKSLTNKNVVMSGVVLQQS